MFVLYFALRLYKNADNSGLGHSFLKQVTGKHSTSITSTFLRFSVLLETNKWTCYVNETSCLCLFMVLLVDDLLATGGTIAACGSLVEQQGGIIAGYSFLIELEFLSGREKLANAEIHRLLSY